MGRPRRRAEWSRPLRVAWAKRRLWSGKPKLLGRKDSGSTPDAQRHSLYAQPRPAMHKSKNVEVDYADVQFHNPLSFDNENGDGVTSPSEDRPTSPEVEPSSPTMAAFDEETGEAPTPKEAEWEHKMTDDELSALAYAFQALDNDGGGTDRARGAARDVLGDGHRCQSARSPSADAGEHEEVRGVVRGGGKSRGASAPCRHDEQQWQGGPSRQHKAWGQAPPHVACRKKKKKHVLIRTAKYAHQHLVMTPVRVPMSYSQKLMAISYGLANI